MWRVRTRHVAAESERGKRNPEAERGKNILAVYFQKGKFKSLTYTVRVQTGCDLNENVKTSAIPGRVHSAGKSFTVI